MNNSTTLYRFLLLFLCAYSFGHSAEGQTKGSYNLETIENFKKHYHSVTPIKPQKIRYSDSYFLRFPELGAIYNPKFPATRKKVYTESYQLQGKALEYLGFSYSTNRATVKLKGRVGTFYGIWISGSCSSLIEYQVTRDGDYLKVTGKIYKCFSVA